MISMRDCPAKVRKEARLEHAAPETVLGSGLAVGTGVEMSRPRFPTHSASLLHRPVASHILLGKNRCGTEQRLTMR